MPFHRRLLLLLFATAFTVPAVHAAADERDAFAAVRAADADRIAATIAGDVAKLRELLSADLRYAHSDGRLQTMDQFLAAVAENSVNYLSVVPRDVVFQTIAPGAIAMTGRAEIVAQTSRERTRFALRFLSVWREETGRWRLAAYQSSQLLAPAAKSEVAP